MNHQCRKVGSRSACFVYKSKLREREFFSLISNRSREKFYFSCRKISVIGSGYVTFTYLSTLKNCSYHGSETVT